VSWENAEACTSLRVISNDRFIEKKVSWIKGERKVDNDGMFVRDTKIMHHLRRFNSRDRHVQQRVCLL
jgi:hypothetical protein